MNTNKILIGIAISLVILIPWMIFGGDLGTGEATTFTNYGYGTDVALDPWHCRYFNWGC